MRVGETCAELLPRRAERHTVRRRRFAQSGGSARRAGVHCSTAAGRAGVAGSSIRLQSECTLDHDVEPTRRLPANESTDWPPHTEPMTAP